MLGLGVVAAAVAVGCAGVGQPGSQGGAGTGDMGFVVGDLGQDGPVKADLSVDAEPKDMAQATKAPPDLAVTPTPPVDLATAPIFDLATSCTDHIVLNEVKVAGSGTASGIANDEFIELFNPCGTTISLANWTLVHRAASGTTENVIATLSKSIGGNAYFLVAETQCACSTTADLTYTTGTLAATGGGIGLRNPAGTLIDAIGYGTGTDNAFVEGAPAAAPAGGQSIARHPNGFDSDHNDTDFTLANNPSPRAANP
jgi:Lamin Tail Domain